MPHVSCPEVCVLRRCDFQLWMPRLEQLAEHRIELVQSGAAADCYVVDLPANGSFGCGRGQQIRLHYVGNVAKIAARLAISVDRDRRAAQHASDPPRYHSGVSSFRILSGAEDVEIPQAD